MGVKVTLSDESADEVIVQLLRDSYECNMETVHNLMKEYDSLMVFQKQDLKDSLEIAYCLEKVINYYGGDVDV
jgi:hypothetical protein